MFAAVRDGHVVFRFSVTNKADLLAQLERMPNKGGVRLAATNEPALTMMLELSLCGGGR